MSIGFRPFLFTLKNNRVVVVSLFFRHGGMCAASISADSARVVTGSGDKLARVWDASRFPRQTLAFVMALHPRLGDACPARELESEIVKLIGEQIDIPCWARGCEA